MGALIMLGFLVWTTSLRINKTANKWFAVFIFSVVGLMLADSLWYEGFWGYPYSVISLNLTLFYTFTNHHRIEESKTILTNPKLQYLSMVGVAYEAGFNSKTTFNTTFKK